MNLFLEIKDSITKHSERNSFCINGVFYKYSELAQTISQIRRSVQINVSETEKVLGLVANDDLETYASIIALWFEGKSYVPLSSEFPKDRIENIIEQAQIKTILDSSDKLLYTSYRLVETKKLINTEIDLTPKNIPGNEIAYLLFTSGTTGMPKGVPITRSNLTGFISAFWDMQIQINESDRVLQMFELTFDLSVMSYLIPLLKGACVYTIPKDKIKYSYIYELMEDQKLTVALMVPSILQYLRPYFEEINLPDMKYSLFCGEALPLDITEEWSCCIPNAEIINVYGPTEDTIFCTSYSYKPKSAFKSHNGILSIGKAMKGTDTIIVDDGNALIVNGGMGELCLGGIQLTPGYWRNEEKNKEAFFYVNYNGIIQRFYRTGDICFADSDGDILYIGRKDFQIKVQGFRVELCEIEYHARLFLEKTNVVCVAITDAIGNTEIGLAIESEETDFYLLVEYLKNKLPVYMIPRQIKFIMPFPLNVNGKTDRKKLQNFFIEPAR
jgi:D-alanine--poly(phosphoribitol) ligase subunit 1